MSPTLRRRSSRGAAPAPDETPVLETAPESAPETAPAAAPAPEAELAPEPAGPARRGERRRTVAHSTPVLLARAAHPRHGLLTATGLAVAAALSGRAGREVALVFATVLVGQAVLGWHNDLVDRRRDARRESCGKPIAEGYLDPGTVWFALICAVLLLVPLSVANGVTAGSLYLATVGVGMVGNVVLRRGWLSWAPWAVAYAGYPAFLSYGGWGGEAAGEPPQPAMVALAAALGVGVHVLCALPGLVADHEDGHRHLPLRVALKIGATRLLVLALAWVVLAVVGLLVVGNSVGLSR